MSCHHGRNALGSLRLGVRFVLLGSLALLLLSCSSDSADIGTFDPDWNRPIWDAGGETGGVEVKPRPDIQGGDAADNGSPDVEPLPPGELEFVDLVGGTGEPCRGESRCLLLFESISVRRLEVRYREGGNNKPGALLQYRIIRDDKGQGSLNPTEGRVETGGNGQAWAELSILHVSEAGQFGIEVSVVGRDDVSPILFDIVVDPKGLPPLTVVPDYFGSQPVRTVYTMLFRQPEDPMNPGHYNDAGVNCGVLMDHIRSSGGTAGLRSDVLSPEGAVGQSISFSNLSFPTLEQDEHQMYTILALGESEDGILRVAGCDDTRAHLTFGRSVTVVVPMHDLPLRLRGTYEVESQFDLISGLPPVIGNVMYWIIDLFQDPAQTVLRLGCELTGSLLEQLCGYFFDGDGNLLTLGALVVGIINNVIRQAGQGQSWYDVIQGGADVGDILTNLRFRSRMTFHAEPDINGIIHERDTFEEWIAVRYRWTLGIPDCDLDPNCGWNQFSFSAIHHRAVTGKFSGRINTAAIGSHAPYTLLTIDPHPVQVSYGALVNYLLKNEILPRLAGGIPPDGLPIVDDYAKLIKMLLAGRQCLLDEVTGGPTCCYQFVDRVMGEISFIDPGFLAAACDALVSFGALYLESLLIEIQGDFFQIGTPDDVPCVMYDNNNNMQVDALGRADAPCSWLLEVPFVGNSTFIDATFTGTRN